MNSDDLDYLGALLRQRSGLVLTSDKAYLIESRLSPVARKEGYSTVDALIAALRAQRDEKLIGAVVDTMTINETFFFRDKTPFEQFRSEVLPALSKSRTSDIKIWCAACSTGQEPYSLAMLMEEARIQFPKVNLDILATDISQRCLDKAQLGLYTQFEIQRGLPIQMLVKNFEKVDDIWRISARLRSAIRYRLCNLIDDLKSIGRQDVIFCRNVLIYFDVATKRAILDQMASLLADDGYLFLGAAETVLGITESFKPLPGNRGIYIRNKVAAPVRAAGAA